MAKRVERDAHHTCHTANEWRLRSQAEAIRENSSMIARGLARSAHNLLHSECSPVPVPDYYTLLYVATRLPSGLDIMQGIDTYSSLVEQAIQRPKTKYIDKKLGELSIEAIQAQKIYIKDGMPSLRRVLV